MFSSHDLGPLTYKPSGLSISPPKRGLGSLPPQPSASGVGSVPAGDGACRTQSLCSGRPGIGLQHFHEILMSRLRQERGRAGEGGAFAAVTARCSGPGKPAGPARSRPFPPTRQGVPASRLPAVKDGGGGTALRGRGAWQAWFLAFSPCFLSRTGRPGDGTQHKPPSPGA